MSIKMLLILTIALVVALFVRIDDFYRSQHVLTDGQRASIQASVTEEPKLQSGRQRLKLQTTEGMRLTVLTSVAPLYHYGDDLRVDGVFTKSEYKGHTYWVIYFPTIQTVNKEQKFITNVADGLRFEAKKLSESTLPPVSSSLLLGIVLGGKHGMPDDFLEKLQTTGVLHVIAASGMNISFVAAFLIGFLAKFLRRSLTLFTAIAGISFYVIVAGFEPSIVRAAIMSSFALIASLLGRQSTGLWTLCLTGYLMLFVSPHLWEDVGFQLSFLSTLGILIVKPLLGELRRFGRLGKWEGYVNDDIMTSLAAQIATLPILLGVFGSYGLLSILVNALILWTVPILMALGSLAILVGLFFAPLGKLLLLLSYPFLWFFEWIVTVFGSAGWVVQIPEVPVAVWIGYYALLGAVLVVKRKKVMERKEEMILREV